MLRSSSIKSSLRIALIGIAWLIPALVLALAVPSHAAADCSVDPDGTACDDGNPCTAADSCLAGTCVGTAVANATDLSFSAVADVYSDISQRTTNFGSDTTLRVDGKPGQRVYLRFDVSGLGGLFVQSAVIRLQTGSEANNGGSYAGDMHSVSDNSWDESTLTHDLRPAIDGPLLSTVGAVNPDEVVDFDVTAAITGDGTYSFGIEPGSSNLVVYHSREAAVGQPELVITLATACNDGDACTQTDTCVDGSCVGSNAVVCTASDQCHDAGSCDSGTGLCSDPAKADGTSCDDGDACTQSDSCQTGSCVGVDPIVCTAADQCHDAGTCDSGTGLCSDPAKADGTSCDDSDACTQSDSCQAGICVGTDPIVCTASDQCHDVGSCDAGTGLCSDPVKADGSACDDGNACTVTDTCFAGSCTGAEPIICTASDQCHDAGTCNPATGLCSDPAKADGSACDDGSACTKSDACQAGSCVGSGPVVCGGAPGQCYQAGVCDPATGLCSNPVKAEGSACDDGNACTRSDACVKGQCVGSNPVVCTALNACHVAGSCNPATGVCSNPAKANGSACDDGDACTDEDTCIAGSCVGGPVIDSDGDGFCDLIDMCPNLPDPAQLDLDGDGIGDACQCNVEAPGRCLGGGGSKRTECLMELTTTGPLSFNKRGNKLKNLLRCSDGDLSCDLDGARDGQCTFGVSLCFGNLDPRYPKCAPSAVDSIQVLRPNPAKSDAAQGIEAALGTLGLEVRRRNKVITGATTSMAPNQCSPLIKLVTPGPKNGKGKAVKQKFIFQAGATRGKRDKDKFVFMCE